MDPGGTEGGLQKNTVDENQQVETFFKQKVERAAGKWLVEKTSPAGSNAERQQYDSARQTLQKNEEKLNTGQLQW